MRDYKLTFKMFVSGFTARFHSMLACKNSYYIVVLEDTDTHRVIGSATLAVEQKFIRGCSSVSSFLSF